MEIGGRVGFKSKSCDSPVPGPYVRCVFLFKAQMLRRGAGVL